jgi:capsular polysaccharide transport system permease protein
MSAVIRSPWQVTRSVWKALFLREFLTRIMADRLAWFWMLFEPIALVTIMVAVRTVVLGRNRYIAGAEYVPWLLVGLLSFFLFRENMMRSIGAVDSNRSLFAYRQIKPVDPVLVRCFLEGMIKTVIFSMFIAAGVLLGLDLFPDNFPRALFGWISLWLLGLAVALTLSAAAALVTEIGKIVRISSLPLLIISGVIFPLNLLPHDLLQILMLNPIVHGLELTRSGFFSTYRMLPGTDLVYLWFWILSLLLLGMMLHIRYEPRLKAL